MLDLKLLTTFREVAVRGSFSDAAVALHFTQPAVSQHISQTRSALVGGVRERWARGGPPGRRLPGVTAPGLALPPPREVLARDASGELAPGGAAEDDRRDAAGVG